MTYIGRHIVPFWACFFEHADIENVCTLTGLKKFFLSGSCNMWLLEIMCVIDQGREEKHVFINQYCFQNGKVICIRAQVTYEVPVKIFVVSLVFSSLSWKWKQRASSTIILLQMLPCLSTSIAVLLEMLRSNCRIQTVICFAFNSSRLDEASCFVG